MGVVSFEEVYFVTQALRGNRCIVLKESLQRKHLYRQGSNLTFLSTSKVLLVRFFLLAKEGTQFARGYFLDSQLRKTTRISRVCECQFRALYCAYRVIRVTKASYRKRSQKQNCHVKQRERFLSRRLISVFRDITYN